MATENTTTVNKTHELSQRERFSEHSRKWTGFFRENKNHMDHVPWSSPYELVLEERAAIEKSIAVFQLGENAEGNAFKRSGREYARRTGDFEYLTALELFIKEEQSHSAALGRFMKQQNIPLITKDWSDSTFRFIRRLAGLNVCITVLITAEIIAAVYYRALGNATKSPALRAICGQILNDEAHHLKFQAGTLAKERMSWHPLKRWFFVQLHRALLFVTIMVVWKEHYKVYRAGNMSFFQWASMTWSVLEEVLLTIKTATIGFRDSKNPDKHLPLPSDTITARIPGLPTKTNHKHGLQKIYDIASLLD